MSDNPRKPSLRGPESADDIEAEFPEWSAFRNATNGLAYAGKKEADPPVLLKAEDWMALRDEINSWEGNQP